MEEFIERSNALLTVRPAGTRVTMRYTHKKVAEGGERVDPGAKPAKIVIKTVNSKSGIIYKYKIKKANELSRILASLGPQNFEFASDRKRGATSLMSGVEPAAEPVTEPTAAAASEPAATETGDANTDAKAGSSKSQKKKKKAKK